MDVAIHQAQLTELKEEQVITEVKVYPASGERSH